jgi:signal transduction histidine kinase
VGWADDIKAVNSLVDRGEREKTMTQNGRGLHLADAIMHELKTSLTAIIVSAELLADEIKPEEKSVLGRLIQSVLRNAHSIEEKISLLSEAEGLLVDNSRFQPELIDIGEIAQNVITQLYPEIQSRRQILTLDIPDNLPAARADRQYLEQIILTLVAKYSFPYQRYRNRHSG